MDVKSFEDTRWQHFQQKPEFRHSKAVALVAHDSVLDIGCGDGLLLRMLREKGIVAEGVDISEVAAQQCREQGFKVAQADFANAPLPYVAASFHTVIALDVLEHVYDPAALLREMARVSSSDIIIGVPNFSSLPARLQTLFGRVPENNHPNKGHIYWFNWPVLTGLLREQGLRVVSCKTNAWLGNKPLVGIVARWLARTMPNLFALSFVISIKK